MSWAVLAALLVALLTSTLAVWSRRRELERQARGLQERDVARARGSHQARLQYPLVDASRCIGCGVCVAACPEEGVLDVIHGQAIVVHGARCVGHGRCAAECPVGAIALTLGDVSQRRDLPVLDESLESPQAPGVFLAGEVTGFALIRTAVEHGAAVAREVARRVAAVAKLPGELDLCIVGAGPAGLSCALEAKSQGLDFVLLEQGTLGGTVAHYPRQKLVMTQPAELPLHGRMSRATWSKEELMELWTELAQRHALPVQSGVRFDGAVRSASGALDVATSAGQLRARNVCIAVGRRGTPRLLEVPGEELSKVTYALVDARSYAGRRVLVVGGGDSAVEAAIGLAAQEGCVVTLSYRKEAFFRLKARNEQRLREVVDRGALTLLLPSQVRSIEPDRVQLEADGGVLVIPNDDVFVLIGGVPPFRLLEECGVSLDPADRKAEVAADTSDAGLLRALTTAALFAVLSATWAVTFRGYYALPLAERLGHPLHEALRPSRGWGLGFGVAAAACIVANLTYLLRRNPVIPLRFGAPRVWMATHVVTGLGALLLALLHGAMAPRDTVGGHAFAGLAVLVFTGAVGRYLYAYVPRAANGRELAIDEARDRIARLAGEWQREHRAFGERVRLEVQRIVDEGRWRHSLAQRLLALLGQRRRIAHVLDELEREGLAEGIPAPQVRRVLALARRAHRAALMVARYEDLRGLMASWRYLHRWVALLMVLLVIVHVVSAMRFGELFGAPR